MNNSNMKYILESNGVFVNSVSKNEVTLTKKKEEAKEFDSLDAMNHKVLLEMDWGMICSFNILEA